MDERWREIDGLWRHKNYSGVLIHASSILEESPTEVRALYLKAWALTGLNDLKRAIEVLADLILMHPDCADAYFLKGEVSRKQDLLDKAIEAYSHGLTLSPDSLLGLSNRAALYILTKSHADALNDLDRAISLNPCFSDALWHKGQIKLLQGNYKEGWALNEARKYTALHDKYHIYKSIPSWDGVATLKEKRIVVYAEQGLGDAIQFFRFLDPLIELADCVTLDIPRSLWALLNNRELHCSDAFDCSSFDLSVPLMSLPHLLGCDGPLPTSVPYIQVDAGLISNWQKRVDSPRKKIGIAWRGASNRDIDAHLATRRWISLIELAPLFELDYDFHLLQPVMPCDANELSKRSIAHHSAHLSDFAQTAALMLTMDHIVTIDTSIAHLAGALGKAAWVMLPYITDYRWGLDIDRTPWYPDHVLFRQSTPGNWKEVVDQISHRLGA